MKIISDSTFSVSIKEQCDAFGLSEASYYRWKQGDDQAQDVKKTKKNFRRLSAEEESLVLQTLCENRFVDMAPDAIVSTLLDEGIYLCSARTMYRILKRNKAVKERRNQRTHPEYKKPELLATGPNQLWSWDITQVRTGKKWSYHYLYVIMDVYSRYVVGWLIAHKENAILAEQLILETCLRQGIERGKLTIHADRGSAMTSKTVSQLMVDLGVTRTHSRPHVSNDNPYSESHFKTMKYHSSYPKSIPLLNEARDFFNEWFNWYNNEHHHSGIEMLTPSVVHHGKDEEVLRARAEVLMEAYLKNPARFQGGAPKVKALVREVWINKPAA